MKARIAKAIILGGVIGLAGVILSLIPFGPEIEKNEGLDILFKLRGKGPRRRMPWSSASTRNRPNF